MLLWILLAVLGADYADQENANAALACPPGSFYAEGQCLHCPVGTSSNDGSACYECPLGTFAPHPGMPCMGCEAGKFSVMGKRCEVCPAGTFAPFGSAQCKDCPPGTTSVAGAQSLSLCMSSHSISMAPPQPEEEKYEVTVNTARAPMENALELHNEAKKAKERAHEAKMRAEAEMVEAKKAHHEKMKAELELYEVKEEYAQVFTDKMHAEERQHNANKRYQEEHKEAEFAEKQAEEAKEKSDQAAVRAFEASHAVKMESEGEAASAVIKAEKEADEHFEAKLKYKHAHYHAEEQESEYEEAEEKAEEAIRFAKKEHEEARIAAAELMAAESHLEVQKVEAEEAETAAERAHHEHELAKEHHENVLENQERGELVWEELVAEDCVNDPKGLVSTADGKTCDEVGDGSENPHWSCHHFDEDFNGHATFIWELCPVSCHMCGTDRDQYYEDHHHKEDEHDDLPECLADCVFDGLDINDNETACPWWKANGPEHNIDSCFNDCSPGVMYYVEHHVQKVCHGGPDNNPLECAMDCPIDGLNPHTAESFCPWFSAQKTNMCFADCTDKFLDMAQAHAEHTCFEYELEGDRFTSYIQEPLADVAGASMPEFSCHPGFYPTFEATQRCEVCPAGLFSEKGHGCDACPSDLTSFPGSTSSFACFVRQELQYNSEDESFDGEDESFDSENQSYDDMKNESFPEIDEEQYQDMYASVGPEYKYDYVNQYETYEPEGEDWETNKYQETVYPDMTTYPPTYPPTKTYDQTAYAGNTYEMEYPTHQETVYPDMTTYQPTYPTKTYDQTAYAGNTYETEYPTETYQHNAYPSETYQQNAYPSETYQQNAYPSEAYQQTVYPAETYTVYPTETYTVYPTETYSAYPAETYTVYPTETYTPYPATTTMQPEFQMPESHDYNTYPAATVAPLSQYATYTAAPLSQYATYTAAPIYTHPTATEYSKAPEAYTTSTGSTYIPSTADGTVLSSNQYPEDELSTYYQP